MVAPGDLVRVWFPFSHAEAEPFKKRPVLVLAIHGSPPDQAVLVAMVTGNPQRFAKPGPGDVSLADWESFGLLKPSVIRTRRIWTAEMKDLAGAPFGLVTPELLEEVRAGLRAILA